MASITTTTPSFRGTTTKAPSSTSSRAITCNNVKNKAAELKNNIPNGQPSLLRIVKKILKPQQPIS